MRLYLLLTFIFLSYLFFDKVHSQDDIECNKCVDIHGNPCNDVIRRFSTSKYWIVKGDKKGDFHATVHTCQELGFIVAEINSELEQMTFSQLATSGDKYWLGFVKQKFSNEWTKLDETLLSWMSPSFQDDPDIEVRAISVDSAGTWYNSAIEEVNQIICQFPVGSKCYRGTGQNPSTTAKSTENVDCPEPEFEDNKLIRTGPNSKFLYPKRVYFTSSKDARALCDSLDLEPAIIDGKWEYKHLVDFVYGKNLNSTKLNFKVNLGAIFKTKHWNFEYLNRQPPYSNQLKFQAFKLKDGQYFADGADCLGIEWNQHYHNFVPIPCEKKSEVMPLCQYKPDGDCSIESPIVLGDLGDTYFKKLMKIGETSTFKFYGSLKQKTWYGARQTCEGSGLKLLGFKKDKPEQIKEALDIIRDYRKNLGTNPWSGFSWTSGRFRSKTEFIFDISSEPWNINENITNFKLNDELTVDKVKENCLVATSNGFRPVICELPNYFVCVSIKESVTTTTTTTTPKSPDTTTDKREDQTTKRPKECGDQLTVSFSPGGLTNEEIMRLIKASISLEFSSGLSDDLPINEKSRWRIEIVKQMGELTKLICPQDAEELELPTNREIFWKKLLLKYPDCQNESQPLTVESSGGLITKFGVKKQSQQVNIVNEKADSYPILDYMLEGLWYMFELSAATCYKATNSKILWLSEFFYYFRKDFTNQFKEWWVNPGETNYGLLFGDMDLFESLYNLRACSVANFQNLEIEDISLVRPVDISNREHILKNLNHRVGSRTTNLLQND